MYYSYKEIVYVATSFSPARMDLALKLLTQKEIIPPYREVVWSFFLIAMQDFGPDKTASHIFYLEQPNLIDNFQTNLGTYECTINLFLGQD